MTATSPRLDIIIPVHNEGVNIRQTLQSIARAVKSPKCILICYDREDDEHGEAMAEDREPPRNALVALGGDYRA
jgi:GT2 family glycosyltransferase